MIVPIETIEREARAAQAAGLPHDACRYPFTTAAGRAWKDAYDAAALEAACTQYGDAIAESSCTN